ncbi:fibronectin type III domain-containing protein [Solibacillus silvestris]
MAVTCWLGITELSRDLINATTEQRVTFYCRRTKYNTYFSNGVKLYANQDDGSYVNVGKVKMPYDGESYVDRTVSVSWDITVQHDLSSGVGSVSISAYSDDTQTSAGVLRAEDSFELATLDREAATISAQIDDILTDGFTINAAADNNCDIWEYSLNNDDNWITFSESDGQSASVDISGLSIGTIYHIKVRARRTDNHVYGTSESYSVRTLGGEVYISNGSDGYVRAISYVSDGNGFKVALPFVSTSEGWERTEY